MSQAFTFSTFVAFGDRFSLDINVFEGGWRFHTIRTELDLKGLKSEYDMGNLVMENIELALNVLRATITLKETEGSLTSDQLYCLKDLASRLKYSLEYDDEYTSTAIMAFVACVQRLNRVEMILLDGGKNGTFLK